MFARRCSRLVAAQTARPLQSYISRFYSTGSPAYEYILTSTPKPGVGLSTTDYLTVNLARMLLTVSSHS